MELQCQIHESQLEDSVYSRTSRKRPSKMQRLSADRLREVTLGARDFSSVVSGFCQVFIVTRFAARGFGLRPKMCRPSANTENSHRTQEKPLVPRVTGGGHLQESNYKRSLPRRGPDTSTLIYGRYLLHVMSKLRYVYEFHVVTKVLCIFLVQ